MLSGVTLDITDMLLIGLGRDRKSPPRKHVDFYNRLPQPRRHSCMVVSGKALLGARCCVPYQGFAVPHASVMCFQNNRSSHRALRLNYCVFLELIFAFSNLIQTSGDRSKQPLTQLKISACIYSARYIRFTISKGNFYSLFTVVSNDRTTRIT